MPKVDEPKSVPGLRGMVPDGFYTRPQVAELVGRSVDTIRRWHKEGRYVATHFMSAGSIKVWLYNDDDIKALREVAEVTKAGRPANQEAV